MDRGPQDGTSSVAAQVEVGAVVSVDHLGGGMVEITAELPRLAATALPGQFAQLHCGNPGPLLRRPFSVAWTEAGLCSFVLAPVGAGTTRLATLRPGDQLDALGPLGHGYTVTSGSRAVCVSGGLGCAPFPLLVRALRAAGVAEVVVLNGAATAEQLYPPGRFGRGEPAVWVQEATDDGSRGHQGRVTELIGAVLDTATAPPASGGHEVGTATQPGVPAPGTTALYACGPNPMLEAVAAVLRSRISPHPIREASLEAPMGCGFGVCLGCALPVLEPQPGWALCCREGPVMPLDAIDWAGLRALPAPHVA